MSLSFKHKLMDAVACVFAGLSAAHLYQNFPQAKSHPRTPASRAEIMPMSARNIDLSFQASSKSYNVFYFLHRLEAVAPEQFRHVIVADPVKPGFFRFHPDFFESVRDGCLKDFLTVEGYQIDSFSCVNSGASESFEIEKKCRMFVVLSEPENGGSDLPLLVGVKGTSTFSDLYEDIRGQGAGYLAHLLAPVRNSNAYEVISALGRELKPMAESLGINLKSMLKNRRFNFQFLDSLATFSAKHAGRRLLFGGHSLGGSLASNFANLYTLAKDIQVDLITFNSLAPSVTAQSFLRLSGLERLKGGLVTQNENISGYHVYTYDDPLQFYNRLNAGTHFGKALKLSSRRNIQPDGQVTKIEPVLGHLMNSIRQDIEFTRLGSEAKKFLESAFHSLQSRKTPSGKSFESNRAHWYLSEAERFNSEYRNNINSFRGEERIPELLKLFFQPELVTGLGMQIPDKIIGKFRDLNGNVHEVVNKGSKLPPLLMQRLGCEEFNVTNQLVRESANF